VQFSCTVSIASCRYSEGSNGGSEGGACVRRGRKYFYIKSIDHEYAFVHKQLYLSGWVASITHPVDLSHIHRFLLKSVEFQSGRDISVMIT